jgi:pilus assembly protein TadC
MGQDETFLLMAVVVGAVMGYFLQALLRLSPKIRNKITRFLFAFICTPSLFLLALLINFILSHKFAVPDTVWRLSVEVSLAFYLVPIILPLIAKRRSAKKRKGFLG